jgi:hypothetical protein
VRVVLDTHAFLEPGRLVAVEDRPAPLTIIWKFCRFVWNAIPSIQILIVQSQIEKLSILTRDPAIRSYAVDAIW